MLYLHFNTHIRSYWLGLKIFRCHFLFCVICLFVCELHSMLSAFQIRSISNLKSEMPRMYCFSEAHGKAVWSFLIFLDILNSLLYCIPTSLFHLYVSYFWRVKTGKYTSRTEFHTDRFWCFWIVAKHIWLSICRLTARLSLKEMLCAQVKLS